MEITWKFELWSHCDKVLMKTDASSGNQPKVSKVYTEKFYDLETSW